MTRWYVTLRRLAVDGRLGFTVAWLKQHFRGQGVNLRWTTTSNMLADCLTKPMSADQLIEVLRRRSWAITYQTDFVRTKGGRKRPDAAPVEAAALLRGKAVDNAETIHNLERLSKRAG